MTQQDPARVLFAVAAEGDDEYIWSRLKMLPELFAAGPVAIRVGFFGAEGTRSSRPFMVSRWTTNPADLADLLQKARTRCICGCYVNGQQHSRAGAAGDAAGAVASRGHHRRFFLRRL